MNLTSIMAIFSVTVLFNPSLSLAQGGGDKTGGGGDLVTCLKEGRIVHQLLDVYELEQRGGRLKLDLPSNTSASLNQGLVIRKKIALAQGYYESLDPTRAARYAAEANRILDDLESLRQNGRTVHGLAIFKGPLRDIDDADEDFDFKASTEQPDARRCVKSQLVRQQAPDLVSETVHYQFDPVLWDLLDIDNKVATLYHEAIYREMREHGIMVSRITRRLNGLLVSGEIEKYPSCNYIEILRSQKLQSYRAAGQIELLTLPAERLVCDADHELVKLNQSVTFGSDRFSFEIDQPVFEKGRKVVSAGYLGSLRLSADRRQVTALNHVYSDQPQYKGGTIEFGATSWTIRGLTKTFDAGDAMISLKPDGTVLSIQESGYFNQPLSPQLTGQLENLVECAAKKVRKNASIEEVRSVESILEKARREIPGGDTAAVARLIKDCHQGKTHAIETSQEVRAFVSSLMKPQVVGCVYDVYSFAVTFMVGANAGWMTAKCTLSDGSIRKYIGPSAGLSMLKFGFNFTRATIAREAKKAGIVKVGVVGYDSEDAGVMGHAQIGWKRIHFQPGMQCQGCNEAEKVSGVGLETAPMGGGMNAHTKLLIRVGKKYDYRSIVPRLAEKIMIDKSLARQ